MNDSQGKGNGDKQQPRERSKGPGKGKTKDNQNPKGNAQRPQKEEQSAAEQKLRADLFSMRDNEGLMPCVWHYTDTGCRKKEHCRNSHTLKLDQEKTKCCRKIAEERLKMIATRSATPGRGKGKGGGGKPKGGKPTANQSSTDCRLWAAGHCKFGAECIFSHSKPKGHAKDKGGGKAGGLYLMVPAACMDDIAGYLDDKINAYKQHKLEVSPTGMRPEKQTDKDGASSLGTRQRDEENGEHNEKGGSIMTMKGTWVPTTKEKAKPVADSKMRSDCENRANEVLKDCKAKEGIPNKDQVWEVLRGWRGFHNTNRKRVTDESIDWVESDTFGLNQQPTKQKQIRNVTKTYPHILRCCYLLLL